MMKPLKFDRDKLDDNAPIYNLLVANTPEALKLRRAQSIHWLQQKLGYTKAAAEAAMRED